MLLSDLSWRIERSLFRAIHVTEFTLKGNKLCLDLWRTADSRYYRIFLDPSYGHTSRRISTDGWGTPPLKKWIDVDPMVAQCVLMEYTDKDKFPHETI